MPKDRSAITRQSNPQSLTVDECRELMGWHNRTDVEIEEFLNGLRSFLAHFLDQYYHDELSLD